MHGKEGGALKSGNDDWYWPRQNCHDLDDCNRFAKRNWSFKNSNCHSERSNQATVFRLLSSRYRSKRDRSYWWTKLPVVSWVRCCTHWRRGPNCSWLVRKHQVYCKISCFAWLAQSARQAIYHVLGNFSGWWRSDHETCDGLQRQQKLASSATMVGGSVGQQVENSFWMASIF